MMSTAHIQTARQPQWVGPVELGRWAHGGATGTVRPSNTLCLMPSLRVFHTRGRPGAVPFVGMGGVIRDQSAILPHSNALP